MSSDTQYTDTNRRSLGATFTDPVERLATLQDVFGRKWEPLLLYYLLEEGSLRFNDLKSVVDGISAKMLSESLDHLEARNLVERTLLSDQPVRVEYSLTERGESLRPVLSTMLSWADEHGETTTDE